MQRLYVPYSDAVAARICEELDRGRTLQEICRSEGMPASATVQRWARENIGGFRDRYRKSAHPIGRQSEYSRAIADRVCDGLYEGRTLRDICAGEGMPAAATILNWMKADLDGFGARYREARDAGYLLIADDILDIADDGRNDWVARRGAGGKDMPVLDREAVRRSRLRVMVRCWLLSRMLPRMFGHRVSHEASVDPNQSLREVMRQIDGRTSHWNSSGAGEASAKEGACCPHCGGKLA